MDQESGKLLEIEEKISNFLDVKKTCREILTQIDNNKTKVVVSNGFKGDYYVFLNDSIYLSDSDSVKSLRKLCRISHECVHSIQAKSMQIINFVSWNIEFVLFLSILGMELLYNPPKLIYFLYLIFWILSSWARIFLEIDAVNRSADVTRVFLRDKISEFELKIFLDDFNGEIRSKLYLFVLSLMLGKFFRLAIIVVIFFVLNK